MGLSKNKIQEMDKKLIELAANDFEQFCIISGVDKTQAYVCMERGKGKSNGVIAQSLKISRQAVSNRAKRCVACDK